MRPGTRRPRLARAFLVWSTILFSAIGADPVYAASQQVTGKVIITQGHQSPGCRMVEIQNNVNGNLLWLRIPNTGQEDGILSVTLTALTTGLNVQVTFDPTITTGCGTEPAIQYISIMAAGH